VPKTFGVATAAGKVDKVVADEFRVEPKVIKGEADAQTAYVFYTVGRSVAAYPVAGTKWVKQMSNDAIDGANKERSEGLTDLKDFMEKGS
jgi:hypothetical protein